MKPIQIGLLGCGTVGTGVAKLLIESRERIAARLGTSLNLKTRGRRGHCHRQGHPVSPRAS